MSSGNSRRPSSSIHGRGAIAAATSGAGPPPAAGAGGGGGAPAAGRRPGGWGRPPPRPAAVGRRGRAGRGAPAGRLVAPPLARGGDVLGTRPAAPADDLGALGAPARRHLGVLGPVDGLVEAPAVGRVVAEVGIDAERQVGE